MNAGELKELLKDVPDDMLVVMSKDAEGNYYSPLANTTPPGTYYYEADSAWSGEIKDPDEPDPSAADGFYHCPERREEIRNLPQCLVLWPTN